MATKIRPIVFKVNEPDPPAGFVMNASNAQYAITGGGWPYVYWEGPNFPNGYDGNGKQCVIVNNNGQAPANNLMYANNETQGGPPAINASNLVTGTTTMNANMAGTASGYGKYLAIPFDSMQEAQAYIANITITIVDP